MLPFLDINISLHFSDADGLTRLLAALNCASLVVVDSPPAGLFNSPDHRELFVVYRF